MNEQLSLGSRTLQKRLKEKSLLGTVESDPSTARVGIQGRRRRILHLKAGTLETYLVEKRANWAPSGQRERGALRRNNL